MKRSDAKAFAYIIKKFGKGEIIECYDGHKWRNGGDDISFSGPPDWYRIKAQSKFDTKSCSHRKKHVSIIPKIITNKYIPAYTFYLVDDGKIVTIVNAKKSILVKDAED